MFRGPPAMKSARNNPRNNRTADSKKMAPRNATTSQRKTSDVRNPKINTNKGHSGKLYIIKKIYIKTVNHYQ